MSKRRLTDVVMALVIGLVMVVAGCSSSDSVFGVDEGRVLFVLSSSDGTVVTGAQGSVLGPSLHDDEVDGDGRQFLQSANVTFSSILARNLDGVLINVMMDLPVTVDILSMDDGKEVMLPEGTLPPATYDQVVVVMTQVEAVTHDGTTITITPPGGGWTVIVPICPFLVEEGATTTVGLTFMLKNAFKRHDSQFHFQPHFVCEQD